MKIVAVVPMKLNNKRLPNKNTRAFHNGYPLCTYVLETLLSCKVIDEVYVYCSNEEIKKYLPTGCLFQKRDLCYDADSAGMNEILAAFARDVSADMYVQAHATGPFVRKESVEKGIRAVWEDGYDSAFAVKRVQDFMWKNGKPFNYALEHIPRTQDLEPIYQETSGFYIYEAGVIHEMGRRIGNRPYMVEIGEIEGIDIDEEEDFVMADAVYNYNLWFKGEYADSGAFNNLEKVKRIIRGGIEDKK